MLIQEFSTRWAAMDWGALKGEFLADFIARAVQEAQDRAPVRTGALRASIHGDVTPTADFGTLAADVLYAAYVEFGTGRMAAQPYLQPGLDAAVLALDELATRFEGRFRAALGLDA